MLANEPRLVAREMLLILIPYSLRRPVGDAHTDSSKSGFQPTLRPAAPRLCWQLCVTMQSVAGL